MRAIGQFQAGNYKASGKSRVMWFPSVAAARAEPRLFELAVAIDIDGEGVFYSDILSTVADDGTDSTPAIKVAAVTHGRFVRAEPFLPAGVCFTAAGDGTDDWVRLVTLVNTEYGSGGLKRKIYLLPGNYRAETNFVMPPGLALECAPGVDISCAYIPRTGTITPPYIGPFTANHVPLSTATLTANLVEGARTCTITTTVPPHPGESIVFSRTVGGVATWPGEGFEIESVTGSNPYTLTLDHAVSYVYTTTAIATVLDSNRGIVLKFNNAFIHGPSERLVSIANGVDCEISGAYVDASQCTEFPCSIDTGSIRCHVYDCTTINSPGNAWYTESNYKTTFERLHGINNLQGIGAWGVGHRIVGCTVTCTGAVVVGGFGFALGHVGTSRDDGATRDCSIVDCTASNVAVGVISIGTQNCEIENTNTVSCNIGLYALATSVELTPTRNLTVIGGRYRLSTVQNCVVAGNSSVNIYGTEFSGAIVGGCDLEIQPGSSVAMFGGLVAPGSTDTGVKQNGTFRALGVTFDGSRYGSGSTNYLVVCSGSHVTTLDGCRFVAGTNSDICVTNQGTGVCYTAHVSLVNTFAQGIGLYNTASWVRGPSGGFADATSPVVEGGGYKNYGTAALAGATPVSLPFPRAKATSLVSATRQTLAGIPGHFTAVASAGVGGTLTGTAGDTSTIAWRID